MYNVSEKIIQYIKKLQDAKTPVQNEEVETEKDEKRERFVKTVKELNDLLAGKGNAVKLQEMEFTPLSDKEIEMQANKKVEDKYKLKENSLQTKKNAQVNNLELENQKLQDSVQTKKDEIENAYSNLEEKVNSNAIKRGIARSSIVSEQVKNLNVEKIRDLLGVDEDVASKIKENSDKISSLESDYVQAVNELSINKAIEISDIIEKLKKEQNSQLEKVIKYNNDIKKQQQTLKSNATKLTESEISNINGRIIDAAIEYYTSLPKEERLLAFESDDELLELLGENVNIVDRYLRAVD